MSDIASGVVTKVYENSFPDGGKSVSFRINGDSRYFRCGRNRFSGILEEGKFIKFKFEPVNDKAAKVLGTPKGGSASEAAQAPASTGGGGRDWAANDAAIRYQSSRKDALEMAKLVITSEAIKLPAAQAKKLEVLEALVDRYTAAFFADIETKGAVARTKAPEPVEETPVEAEPEEVEIEDDEW